MGTEVESPNSNNRVSQIITDSFLFLEGEEDEPVNGNAAVESLSPVGLLPTTSPPQKCSPSPNGNTALDFEEEEGVPPPAKDEAVSVGCGEELTVEQSKDCAFCTPINHHEIGGVSGDEHAIGNAGHDSVWKQDIEGETVQLSVSERILKLERIEQSGGKTSASLLLQDSSCNATRETSSDMKDNSCDSDQDTHDKDNYQDTHDKDNYQDTHDKDNYLQTGETTVRNQSEADPAQRDTSGELSSIRSHTTQGHNKVNKGQTEVKTLTSQGQGHCELDSGENYEAQLQEHARYIVSKVLSCNSLREAFKRSQALRKIKRQCLLDNESPVVNSEVARPKILNIIDNYDGPNDSRKILSTECASTKEKVVENDATCTSLEEISKERSILNGSPDVGLHDNCDAGCDKPASAVVLRRKKSSTTRSSDAVHEGGSASCDSENSSPCQSPATRRRHVLRSPVLRLKQEWNSVDMGGDLDSPRHSEDSEDDDDAGIYAESYRNSQWLYLGDVSSATSTDTLDVDTDVSRTSTNSASSGFETTTDTSLGGIDVIGNDTDDVETTQTSSKENLNVSVDSGLGQTEVASPRLYKQRVQYDDLPPTLPRRAKHVRSESISTTASEIEFRKRYQAKTRRIVQRKSSTQTYQRMSERFYDDERCITVEKRDGDRTFGFHIKSCRPVMVSTVEAGSAAELAGIRVGDSVIAVNDVNVLEVSHEEAIRLISQNSQKVKLMVSTDNKLLSDLPLCIGYLNKQGGSGILKNWRRRWFALKQDHCLYYYKTDEDKDPLGAILLTNYTISKAPEANRKNTFKAHKYGQRTYYFQADSEDEMNCWASALSNAAKTTTKADTWLDVSSHNVGLPALSIKSPDCHGHLTKMGNRRKNWKRRYCVLKDACLYYYIDLTSSTAQGVAHLHGYRVEESLPYNKKFGFTILPPDPAMRTFYFFADNETDMRRWINALQKSIGKWVRADD